MSHQCGDYTSLSIHCSVSQRSACLTSVVTTLVCQYTGLSIHWSVSQRTVCLTSAVTTLVCQYTNLSIHWSVSQRSVCLTSGETTLVCQYTCLSESVNTLVCQPKACVSHQCGDYTSLSTKYLYVSPER